MADDAQSIRSLNWRELFPFINLFRAFRVAIHPSKLLLGFAMLVLIYGGGRVLDAIWPASQYAVPDEIDRYTSYKWTHDQSRSFDDIRLDSRETNASEYARHLGELARDGYIKADYGKDPDLALEAARKGEFHGDLQAAIVRGRNDRLKIVKADLDNQLKAIDSEKDATEEKRGAQKRQAHDEYDTKVREAQVATLAGIDQLNAVTPKPLFDAFFEYECRQFRNVIDSALTWNWFGGISQGSENLSPDITGRHSISIGNPNFGVMRCVANMTLIGPGWLLHYHPVYFVLFAVWFLLLWAIFGGAIARIAAVHVSRDEKISVRQALRFSTSKLLSFVFAPVIPLIIIGVAGLIVAIGGLLFYLPVIGPIVGGALMFLALLAGFIITLVATGTVGGFNLMYPTIAVEGSDSFDAISRSFSYVFARPWRMIFYTVVSLIYGALCFLFVRYFVYVMLAVTRFFAGSFLGGQPNRYWPEIWPPISDQDMAYRINFQALSWSEAIAAVFIAAWVYVVLTMLASFVVSFYFSSNTIIYYLMRREVDATELDDVYIEETDEDFAEAAAPAGTTAPEQGTGTEASPPAAPTA